MKKLILLFSLIFLYSCSSNDGYQALFNGEDLEGWHIYGQTGEDYNGWTVQQGVLVYDPSLRTSPASANLVTDQVFESFELSFDWMIAENGNSGIFWAVVESDAYEHPYQTGPEIQILDDGWEEYVTERGDINRAGSLYNLMAPSKVVSKHAGEWNSYVLHINHKKNQGWLNFNGERVLEFPVHGEEWEELIANSGFKDWEGFGLAKSGHISLQDHGGKVAFRNIKIKELN